MALLLSCNSLSKSYGARPLFDDISFGIQDGERIVLIGPNGAGKSTLMKIFAGSVQPDKGSMAFRNNARVAYLPQEDIFPAGSTAMSVLQEAMAAQKLDDMERDVEILDAHSGLDHVVGLGSDREKLGPFVVGQVFFA